MYINRMDNQVQINGFRVELGEIEFRIKEFTKKDSYLFTSGEAGSIWANKEIIGQIGNLEKSLLSKFNIETPVVAAAIIDFEKLTKLGTIEKVYSTLPKFPEIKEDLSVVVDLEIETQTITDLITKSGKPLLKSADPFDQFIGSKLGINKKSITYSLSFAANKTLTNIEVAKVREKIIKDLGKELKAEIR